MSGKEFRKRIKRRGGVRPAECFRTTYKLNYHLNHRYRLKHIKSNAGNTVALEIRDESDLFFDEFPIFKQFYRSSITKKEFLKYLVGVRGLYGTKGAELPQSIICEALGVSQNAVSMYIRQLIEFGILQKLSDSYKVGSFSKRYICTSVELHKIHVKVVHPNPDKKMKRKIKTKERLLKLIPRREEAWKNLTAFMRESLQKRDAWMTQSEINEVVTGQFVRHYFPSKVPDQKAVQTALSVNHIFRTHDNKKVDVTNLSRLFSIKHYGLSRETYNFIHPAGHVIAKKTGKVNVGQFLHLMGKVVSLYRFYERDLLADMNKRAVLLKSFEMLYAQSIKGDKHKGMFDTFLSFYRKIMRKCELFAKKKDTNFKRIRSGIFDLNIAVEFFNNSFSKEVMVDKSVMDRVTNNIKVKLKKITKVLKQQLEPHPSFRLLCMV